MADKTNKSKTKKKVSPTKVRRFIVGGNLSDGTRFEAGQEVKGLSKDDEKALKDVITEDA